MCSECALQMDSKQNFKWLTYHLSFPIPLLGKTATMGHLKQMSHSPPEFSDPSVWAQQMSWHQEDSLQMGMREDHCGRRIGKLQVVAWTAARRPGGVWVPGPHRTKALEVPDPANPTGQFCFHELFSVP